MVCMKLNYDNCKHIVSSQVKMEVMMIAKPGQAVFSKQKNRAIFIIFEEKNVEDIYFSYFGTRLLTMAISVRVQLQCVLSFEFALSLSVYEVPVKIFAQRTQIQPHSQR